MKLQTSSHCGYSHLVFQKPWINLRGDKSPLLLVGHSSIRNQKKQKRVGVRCSSGGADAKPVSTATVGGAKSTKVKVILTVLRTVEGYFTEVGIQRGIDDIKEVLGKSLLVELLSAELDPS